MTFRLTQGTQPDVRPFWRKQTNQRSALRRIFVHAALIMSAIAPPCMSCRNWE
jgi:hypothetical protein